MSGNDGYGYGSNYSYGYDYSYQNNQQPHQQPYTTERSNMNPAPSSWNNGPSPTNQSSNFAFGGSDIFANPAAQVGLQFGSQAFSAGQQYVNSNLNRWVSISLLREYFCVTNNYVFQKIFLLFVPFIQKVWQRKCRQNQSTGQIEGFLQPREDVNAPDLYIPIMALVTYIILVGLFMGMKNAFHPEVLGITATSCVMVVFIEVFLIKLSGYVLSVGGDIHFLDFIAYSGYKFCILIVAACFGHFGGLIKYLTIAYLELAYGFFLLRSLRPLFVPENSNSLVLEQRRKRINFLLAVVGLELVSTLFLLK